MCVCCSLVGYLLLDLLTVCVIVAQLEDLASKLDIKDATTSNADGQLT